MLPTKNGFAMVRKRIESIIMKLVRNIDKNI